MIQCNRMLKYKIPSLNDCDDDDEIWPVLVGIEYLVPVNANLN
jgi:hypothetical protein